MIPERYTASNLRQALRNPRKFSEELQRIEQKIRSRVFKYTAKRTFQGDPSKEVDIMEQDWDNLIILDACRYDVFCDWNCVEGNLDYVISKGSHSKEFRDKTFSGRTFHDTVYVTANAFGAQLDHETFHDILTTFDVELEHESETAIHDNNNLEPKKIYDLSLDAYKKYPDKKLIIHFMQPHEPYFGDRAEELRETLSKKGLEFFAWGGNYEDRNEEFILRDLLEAAEEDHISNKDLQEIYIENLEIVLKYVKDLLEELDGKTIITADHGELLGDEILFSDRYHHPKELYVEELRKVPWLVIESNKRRSVTTDPPSTDSNIDQTAINNQLEALGYK